jgi:hypothetical protein
MRWPLSQDYNEAIQNPTVCFSDPDLRRGEAVCNAMGLPAPCSGNFADVYAVATPQRKWAVKCFTRQIPGLRERYQQISLFLEQVKLPFMVDFTFLDRGIRVRGTWYPVLKMEWVEGLALNQFVREQLDNPAVLETLCQIWVRLARRLREANLAHCDLQHGNVLLVPGGKAGSLGVKLVDYDGMCVPALTLLKSIEVGHPAYQHPQRQRERIYNLEVDRFSHLVIYTALRALVVGGRPLWERYDNGDNLLFRQQDLEAPGKSALFYELLRMEDPSVRFLAENLIDAARKPLEQTPLLGELIPDAGNSSAIRARKSASPPEAAQFTAPPAAPPPVVYPFPGNPPPERGRRNKVSMLIGLASAVALFGVLAGAIVLVARMGGSRPSHSGQVAKDGKGSTPRKVANEEASPRLFLANANGFDWSGYNGLGKGSTTAEERNNTIAVNGVKYPLGLGMHPNPSSSSQVKFLLRGLKARRFTSSVAVNDTIEKGSESPLTFTVLGDGKPLWTSKPVQRRGTAQECSVNVSGIDVLELRVHCPGGNGGAHAVWLDPCVTTGVTQTELNDYLKRKPHPLDLRIVAVIDGSDELRLTAAETRWAHGSWEHPTQVKLNALEWNPKATPLMKNVGIARLLGRPVEDLSKVRMKKIHGRGRVELRSGKDFVTVVFDDPEPGADVYEVILTFGQ